MLLLNESNSTVCFPCQKRELRRQTYLKLLNPCMLFHSPTSPPINELWNVLPFETIHKCVYLWSWPLWKHLHSYNSFCSPMIEQNSTDCPKQLILHNWIWTISGLLGLQTQQQSLTFPLALSASTDHLHWVLLFTALIIRSTLVKPNSS